ncbi:hypothetical protein AC579_8570 [Pseudocercospora musae]|uniref:Uncharacterized protein n=1 Tax=Pseudocercospora musae TaxID=113226 RepID=A0A139IBA8_9PEZI|nr:hypothetical protein AC579_8570 [Pseudocercospora musae]
MRRFISRESTQRTESASRPPFLALPYDVRFLIYQNAFPAGKQIYIQASPDAIHSITTSSVPISLLSTCHSMDREAGEYLYNNYLFNLVGRKQDCLKHYETLQKTMEKYTRAHVHVDAFSNGDHSKTMAIALHAGEGKVEMLKRRERGLKKTIRQLREEVGEHRVHGRRDSLILRGLAFMMWASLIGLLAWVLGAY